MAATNTASSPAIAAAVRRLYREMLHHVKQVQLKQSTGAASFKQKEMYPTLEELRRAFRDQSVSESATSNTDEVALRKLKEAESRLAVWRMSSRVKPRRVDASPTSQVYIYRDGQRFLADETTKTLRDSNGRVVCNWNGSNLDPESVKRHRQQLKRAGFVNNQHAKGFF